MTPKVKLRFILVAALAVSVNTISYRGDIFGSDDSFLSSSFLQFEDLAPSRLTIKSGEIVSLTGFVHSQISVNMTVSLYLASNATEGKDWLLVDVIPNDSFHLPAGDTLRYNFTVRFLKHGIFLLQPSARILEIPNYPTPIDSSSPDCDGCKTRDHVVFVQSTGTESEASETGRTLTFGWFLPLLIIAIIGIVAVWILRKKHLIF